MKQLFGEKNDPDRMAREAIRKNKWIKAIASIEKQLRQNERDFAAWNLLGDLYMNNKATAQAVEAWRRALDGYAMESLHENVIGIGKKILREVPEEEDVLLTMAEAYLDLDYIADCLSMTRTYLRQAKNKSESETRSIIKKILQSPLPYPHLREELRAVYKDSRLEEIELEREIEAVLAGQEKEDAKKEEVIEEPEPVDSGEQEIETEPEPPVTDGLQMLGDAEAGSEQTTFQTDPFSPNFGAKEEPQFSEDFETAPADDTVMLAEGEGKDHFDLGMVYREMKLWDAAIAEFREARRDPSMRLQATLALSECCQETHDLQSALELLEAERRNENGNPQDRVDLHFRLGVVNELLGNVEEALKYFEIVKEQNPDYEDAEKRVEALRSRLQNPAG